MHPCKPTGATPSADEMLRRARERWPLTMLRLAYQDTVTEEIPEDMKKLIDDLQ